jgi:hypothetical protein
MYLLQSKRITLVLFIITFCLSLFLIPSARALDKDWTFDPKTSSLIPNYMGKVKVLHGKAIVADRELEKGSKVYANDLISTAEKSLLVIEMIDMTVITLGPSSEFKVEKWSYRTKNDRDALFSILKGQWRALIKSKSKTREQLQIKTPQVSMGVRGTELLVNVLNQKNKDITQVALLEGAVHIYGSNGNKDQDLQPGDHAIIIKGPQGIEHQNETLSSDKMKSFQEFVAPEVPRLLEPIVLNDTSI